MCLASLESLQDNEVLQMIESVCITWFTIEYVVRFAGNFFVHFPAIANMGEIANYVMQSKK